MNTQQYGPIDILYLAGRFDAYEVPKVAAWLNQQIDMGRAQLVINLGDVTFIDSAALSTLIQGMKRARQHQGDCRLCTLQQPVRIIIELTRLNKAFAIFADESSAIGSFAITPHSVDQQIDQTQPQVQ